MKNGLAFCCDTFLLIFHTGNVVDTDQYREVTSGAYNSPVA